MHVIIRSAVLVSLVLGSGMFHTAEAAKCNTSSGSECEIASCPSGFSANASCSTSSTKCTCECMSTSNSSAAAASLVRRLARISGRNTSERTIESFILNQFDFGKARGQGPQRVRIGTEDFIIDIDR